MAVERERRRHARHPWYAKTIVGETRRGYLRNVSESGARVSVIGSLDVARGDALWLRAADAPAEERGFEAECIVVWCRRLDPYCELGVSFEASDGATQERVRAWTRVLAEQRSDTGGTGTTTVEMIRRAPK